MLKLEELPESSRNRIWSALYRSLREWSAPGPMGRYIRNGTEFRTLLEDIYLDFFKIPFDGLPEFSKIEKQLRAGIMAGKFNKVFDLILVIMRHPSCPDTLLDDMERALNGSNIAYRLILSPPAILPVASKEEVQTIERAIVEVEVPRFSGARRHLINAGNYIATDQPRDSIRESVHAVESVARVLNDGARTSLKPALDALQNDHGVAIHPALKKAMESMYGYTNDEDGIRHALLEDTNSVDQTDALFMLGSCAAFLSYLIGKSSNKFDKGT